ncbi:B12-binding domain-containing radical SAM protein [Methanosarcina sp. UBA5]|uniref:B12-binding domain-containing radical SAM protein n=1 Tax=Methanosarcina sp. UBA5 TaxID=1915593 RepID=UPI0025F2A09C|nr:radical SAM protein [Methanosarcina sp. UBA5]
MNVCFVNALTMSDFGDPELTLASDQVTSPPLGILSLAAVLCEKGITPQVVNLNKLFIDFLKCNEDEKPSDLLTFIVEHIKSLSFEILGLSTICSSYPLTLRIAREIKKFNPAVKIILGGPQASVVDIPTMKAFPFIDFVVRGEAEDTFPLLLEALSSTDFSIQLEKVPGITFRKGVDVIRNPNAQPILDLDRLPLPAYFLDPSINEYKSISLEVGRGCPFNCTFCSTSEFFNRKFRLKSPQKIIEQMKFIKDKYGINNITFTHDNFAANRKKVVEFCEAIINCGEDFFWTCSARTDQTDDELISLMKKAGCQGIFFGVETGSARLQQMINKKLNLSDAIMRIKCTDQHGINTTVSLITAFPEETKDDLRSTVNFLVDLLRFNNVEPQLKLLAPLAGTQLHSIYKDKLLLDYIYSDISYQGWKQNPDDIEMIKANPEVFPDFYSIPTSHIDRLYFKEVQDFVTAIQTWFRWLPVALLQDSGDILNVFDRWRIWRTSKLIDNLNLNANEVPYYSRRKFVEDFFEFVLTYYYNEMAKAKKVISSIIEIENLFLTHEGELAIESHKKLVVFNSTSFPYKPKDLHITRLNFDYKELIQCLRDKKNLNQISDNNVTIAFREANRERREISVRILSPISEELLNVCDGSRTVSDIVSKSSLLKAQVDGIASEKVCYYGLSQLLKQGLIEVSSQPILVDFKNQV